MMTSLEENCFNRELEFEKSKERAVRLNQCLLLKK
jgi:hypothetical protein